MSFDIRAFKDDKSGETFERILKYGQKEGIHTKVRISFDFYAPDVYANPLNPNLEKRFMEVLSLSLPLADEITVNVNGSFKYSRSHIFKTQRFLNDILHRNGFATPFRVGYILADDPEAEIDRLSQQKNESGFSEFELMEMIGFCNPCKNFVPYYEHEGTGKRIDVKYGPTLNMGRWKKVKDKGLIQNPYDRFVPRNERGAHICGVNLSSRFTLYPGGEISACNGGYARRVCFANINEGYDNFVEQYQQVLKSLNQFYQQKLGQIMQGKQNTWLCEMPDLYDKIFEFKG
ncbi:MAG: hypothetical protein NT001_05275 [Candidatus Woesearchaeota archaeon]|nr:hypothetical protein [Candidatus Woesearchaeota archaeon]